MKRSHLVVSQSLAAALLAVGLAACGADTQDVALGGQDATDLSSALGSGLASIEKPSFNVRGITVEADEEGLHIRGAFPGGNPGFFPPAFTMVLDRRRVIVVDTTWEMKSPKGLADKIRAKLEPKYAVQVIVHSDEDVLVRISKRDGE